MRLTILKRFKMSEEKRVCRRKLMKLIFFRIPVILMIISAILIAALKLVERYPNPLRQGFEEYLSKATNRNATIGTLEEIKFFPNFVIDARDVTIHNLHNAAVIDLEIEKININSPFSSMFFNSKKINSFFLENLHANAGMIGPKEIFVSSSEIINKNGPDQYGSFLVVNGTYGGKKVYFEAELEAGKYNYSVPSKVPFSLQIGQYQVNATLNKNFTSVRLENTVFSKSATKSKAKEYNLVQKSKYQLDNPLSCVWTEEKLDSCDKYLENEN